GDDDVVASSDGLGECLHVFGGDLGELFDIAAVEPRRAAAGCVLGEGAFDAVTLVDLHEIVSDRGLLILDKTRGKHRDAALPLGDSHPWTTLEPCGEPLPRVWREQPLARHPG